MDSLAESVSRVFQNAAPTSIGNENWVAKKLKIGQSGTNNKLNDMDSFGDGDQSPLKRHDFAQVHREVWSEGGDTEELVFRNALPPFVMACMLGKADVVADCLEKATTPDEKKKLLETRYGILRLSPLFLVIIAHKTIILGPAHLRKPVEVVRVMIKHGVRVDARDLCGKTVIHYACGMLCDADDPTALSVADLCITRAKELDLTPPLVDIQDRMGGVPLQQAIMLNRVDLVTFLCIKHGANATIKDHDGASPETMAFHGSTIFDVIRKAINKKKTTEFKSTCMVCEGGDESNILRCSGCKIAGYCSKECQKSHWKEHKKVCALSSGTGFTVTIDPTPLNSANLRGNGWITGKTWDGKSPPPGVAMGEFFDVKIQVGFDPSTPMLLYPKEKTPMLGITRENCPSAKELFDLIRAFKPCDGRKAYFRAKLMRPGELFISSDQVFVRKW